MFYIYPAIFKPNPTGGYIVTVPDVPGCVTGGITLETAVKMVKDALCGCLCVLEDENETLRAASMPDALPVNNGEFVVFVEADTTKYRSEHDNKSVRKNVSLPAWLNAKAEQNHINCSQVLQEALKERMGV